MWLRRLHLILGLTAGLLASLSGITGSLLVFRPEIEQTAMPHLFRVTPAPRRALLQTVLDNVRAAHPHVVVQSIFFPDRQSHDGEKLTAYASLRDVVVDLYRQRFHVVFCDRRARKDRAQAIQQGA